MKATRNIRNFATAGLAALAIVLTTSVSPLQASTGNLTGNREIKAAFDRLDSFNQAIEASISYRVSEVSETEAYELDLAWLRLEETANMAESNARYKAPVVAEEITGYEVNMAVENLNRLNLTVAQSLRYTAPSVVD